MSNAYETTGARLSRLRRAQSITQEVLADRLGVSRQAVSKWESDLAYPETDKLLRLSRLYGVTVDYLLTGEEPTAPTSTTAENAATSHAGRTAAGTTDTTGNTRVGTAADPATASETEENAQTTANATVDSPCKTGDSPQQNSDGNRHFRAFWENSPHFIEYKSRRVIGGVPLLHINIGLGRRASGILAIGLTARGVVAIGLASVGVVAVGLASVGVISVAVAALALLLSVGCVSVGTIAIGAVALGALAVGAVAAGLMSVGAVAAGRYLAIGDWAMGGVAIGKSVAEGTWFSHVGSLNLPAADLPEVEALLDTHCPAFWRAAARVLLRWVCR